MAESILNADILSAIKAVQTHLEGQILASAQASNQALQDFKHSVNSRISEIQQPPSRESGFSFRGSSSHHQLKHPSSPEFPPGADLSPILKSMKMDVPRFDGSDPDGWLFRIEEFFDFHGTHALQLLHKHPQLPSHLNSLLTPQLPHLHLFLRYFLLHLYPFVVYLGRK